MKTTRNRFSAEPPFTDDVVIYRHTPEAAPVGDEPSSFWDLARQYVVIAEPDARYGIMVYAHHAAGWIAYPTGSRALIAALLTERTQLLTLCEDRQRLLLARGAGAKEHGAATRSANTRSTQGRGTRCEGENSTRHCQEPIT